MRREVVENQSSHGVPSMPFAPKKQAPHGRKEAAHG